MGGLRILKNLILKNLKSKRTSLIIFWIVCCFISANVNQVKAQEGPSTDPLVAILTIQRTDCTQTDLVDTVSLDFGFDPNDVHLQAVPPEPPGRCIWAFFDHDPNITGFASLKEDSNQPQFIKDLNSELDDHRGPWLEGWQKAIFSRPDPEQDRQWKATWGIRIYYPDLMPNDPNVASLTISWDLNELITGDLQLEVSNESFDMHEKSEIQDYDIVNGALLKVIYSPRYIPREKKDTSVLSIICVGGLSYASADTYAFESLGGNAYLNMITHPNISRRIKPENDIRFIHFKTDYDVDYNPYEPNPRSEVFLSGLDQKDTLEDSIKNWIPDRLSNTKPEEAIIIIYLVDHGESINGGEDCKISLDPNNPNPDKRSLTGSEFKDWLDDLRENLPKKKDQVTPIKHEIYVIVEACHSKSFINQIESGDSDNYILVASAKEDEQAIIFKQGRMAFTWFFWEGVNKAENRELDQLFNYSVKKFKEPYPNDPNQNPYYYAYKGSNIGDPFILDKFLADPNYNLPSIPVIDDVAGSFEITESFASKLSLTVYAKEDPDIDKAWAAIIPPYYLEDNCRFYTDPNGSNCIGNECTLSYECDYFLPPGTEVYVYVKGENTPTSVPYIHRTSAEDSFEPDDSYKQANLTSGELQIHSFHDPNDFDWLKFCAYPELYYYEIHLMLPSSLMTDPNISPFQLTIFTDNEMIDNVTPVRGYQDEEHQGHFIYYWENTETGPTMIYLKIAPAKGCNTAFPYKILVAPGKEDIFEPDDSPEQANLCSGELQIHSFHDPNDFDWFEFCAQPEPYYYEIHLILPSSIVTDPNISPFQLTIFTDNEMIDNVTPLTWDQDEDHQYHFIYYWENTKTELTMINLRIAPSKRCHTVFPYKIRIVPGVAAETVYLICAKVNKGTKDKIKEKIMSFYLLDENGNEVFDSQGNRSSLGWIKSSAAKKHNPCRPEYFCFLISSNLYTTNSCFDLYVKEGTKDERRGPGICMNDKYKIWIDPYSYLQERERHSWSCDLDCDGRTDYEEELDGNEKTVLHHPEVILHSGLNIFRYPFWALYTSSSNPMKIGTNLYTIFCDTNAIFNNQILTGLKNIGIFSKEESSWHYFDAQRFDYNGYTPEIFLENKSASLIYLDPNQGIHSDPNQKYYIVSLLHDSEKSGSCYSEVLDDPNISFKTKKSNTKITIYQGLNTVSFFGYKAISGSITPVGDGYFHSFSAARSLKDASSNTDSMNFSSIMRYDKNQGKWQQSSLFFGRPSGELFPIGAQEGYLIYMNEFNEASNGSGTTGGGSKDPNIEWLPDQIWSDVQYQMKENE